MRVVKFPESKAKLRLLEAAEQLFAERGFEAVSVRDVTQLAKANVAAVNYHFGSRDGLIATVVMRYLAPVNQERLARLESVEGRWAGKAAPLEEIIDAFVRPVAGIVRKSELSERLFCKLVGRIFTMQGVWMPESVEAQMKDLTVRFSRAFAKSLPGISQEELLWRMHFLMGAIIHMLVNQEMLHEMSNGASGTPSMEITLGRFIRFAAAALREGAELPEAAPEGPQAVFDF